MFVTNSAKPLKLKSGVTAKTLVELSDLFVQTQVKCVRGRTDMMVLSVKSHQLCSPLHAF